MHFRPLGLSVFAFAVTLAAISCDPGTGGKPVGGTKKAGEGCAAQTDCATALTCLELNGNQTCADPNDIDGDGVQNSLDQDIDGDGVPNQFDDDVDGDGLTNLNPDGTQNDPTPYGSGDATNPDNCIGAQGDCDHDGIPNALDNDDNGDGIPDGVQGIGSCDNGATIAADESSDCDGYCLSLEGGFQPCNDGAPPGVTPGDTDGDGIPDPLDGDDDGDGIPDAQDGNGGGLDPVPPVTGEGEGEGEGEGQQNCSTASFTPADNIQNPRILFVVDKSGSMGDPDNQGQQKYAACASALQNVTQSLDGTVDMGLITYPNGDGNSNACADGILQVGVGANTAGQIANVLNSTSPGGGTPTAVTLLDAKNTLDSLPADGGPRVVVLATDGGPNCNLSLNGDTCRCVSGNQADCQGGGQGNCLDDTNVINAASLLNAAGYSVFVIGEVGSENFTDVLNAIATAGGTAQSGSIKFYAAQNQTQLENDLRDIAIRVGACRIDLAQNVSPGQLTVTVNGVDVAQDTSRTNGWDLTDPNTVELFGQPCLDTVNGGASATVGVQICDG